MNEKHVSFIFLCSFLLGICLILPIGIMYTPPSTSPCGWVDFDEMVTDLEDDVVQYPITGIPEEGTLVDLHPEIDIINVSFISYLAKVSMYAIQIFFAATPVLTTDYAFDMLIDNDSDNIPEYHIYTAVYVDAKAAPTQVYVQRLTDNYYYNGNTWISSADVCTSSAIANRLNIPFNSEAIPEITASRIAIITAYIANATNIYADFVPLTPTGGGIPGFSIGFIFFGVLTLLGLGILLQRQRISF